MQAGASTMRFCEFEVISTPGSIDFHDSRKFMDFVMHFDYTSPLQIFNRQVVSYTLLKRTV